MTSDADIIRRSLAAPDEFAALFDRHARVVAAFIARRVGVEAAEDIVSETFLVAFRRRADFDSRSASAKPWLFGVAVRLVRRHRAMEAAHWRSIVAGAAAAGAGGGGDGGISAAEARADALTAIRGMAPALQGLSAADRETLQLYAWGDLTYTEVAEALGVPVGTVRSRLNRVRRRLGADAFGAQTEGERHGSSTRS